MPSWSNKMKNLTIALENCKESTKKHLTEKILCLISRGTVIDHQPY